MTPRRPARLAAVGLVALLAAGCGVPRDAAPRPVSPGAVDPSLLGESASPSPAPSTLAASTHRVAFVAAGDRLALVPRAVPAAPVPQEAQDLLAALMAGPDDGEHDNGLSTALPSDVVLRVTALRGDVAEVSIEGGEPDADPRRLPLSVAQVVLTLTSLPEVGTVRLTRDGAPLPAPLPNGELVSRALTAADYRSLLAGRAGTATPSPASSP